MEIDDRTLKLVVKRLMHEATIDELQQLDDLLKRNCDASKLFQLLFEEGRSEEYVDRNDSLRLFSEILARIKMNEGIGNYGREKTLNSVVEVLPIIQYKTENDS
jgi:hypothetical protein